MTKMIATLRHALANRRAYNRALVEISLIAERELADMNIDRDSLIANAHRQVYGAAR